MQCETLHERPPPTKMGPRRIKHSVRNKPAKRSSPAVLTGVGMGEAVLLLARLFLRRDAGNEHDLLTTLRSATEIQNLRIGPKVILRLWCAP